MELPRKSNESVDLILDEEDFVIITDADINSNELLNRSKENLDETSEGTYNLNDGAPNKRMNENDQESLSQKSDESIDDQIIKVEKDFEHWTELRRDTISKLQEIADYIDSVSKKSSIAKAIGSGGGALGGGLTLIGGILTIATAGAALPVLIAGTSIGLASGIGGGAAAVTERIIKSRQMKQAQDSIDADKEATCHLEEDIIKLRSNKKVVNKIAKDVMFSGGSAAYDSVRIFNLVAGKAGAAGTLKAGIEATAQLLGEDIGKEVSKILLHTSGRLLSGGITVVFGGITMAYDIYKLSTEVEAIATKREGDALREISTQLEISLNTFLSGCGNSSNPMDFDNLTYESLAIYDDTDTFRKSKVIPEDAIEPDLEKKENNNSVIE